MQYFLKVEEWIRGVSQRLNDLLTPTAMLILKIAILIFAIIGFLYLLSKKLKLALTLGVLGAILVMVFQFNPFSKFNKTTEYQVEITDTSRIKVSLNTYSQRLDGSTENSLKFNTDLDYTVYSIKGLSDNEDILITRGEKKDEITPFYWNKAEGILILDKQLASVRIEIITIKTELPPNVEDGDIVDANTN